MGNRDKAEGRWDVAKGRSIAVEIRWDLAEGR
jgi:hypothetical protein